MPVRVALGVLLVAIPAVGLGLGFPTGLRLVRLRQSIVGGPDLGPWLCGVSMVRSGYQRAVWAWDALWFLVFP
jgi:hypothetical protein